MLTSVFKMVSFSLIMLGSLSLAVAEPNPPVNTQQVTTITTQQTNIPLPGAAPPVSPQIVTGIPQASGAADLPPQSVITTPAVSGAAPAVVPDTSHLPSLTSDMSEFKQWVERNKERHKNQSNSGSTASTGPLVQNNTTASALPALPPDPKPPIRRIRRVKSRPLTFEQSQKAMLESAPPTHNPPSEEAAIAFGALLQQNMPLAPQQVVRLRQQMDIAQRAAAVTPNIPPKPVSNTLMINLSPGTTPPVIRLAQGYVSSLVFVDSTGTPWPIAAFDIGNPKSVNIQWDAKSNILLIQAVTPYSSGNMVVRLVGLPTPITLEIVAGQRRVDYRVDIHVPGIGPNTKELPVESAIPNGANEILLGVLDGVAPAGSRQLNVMGADCQAWLLGEKIYLRTRLTVLSPGWVGKMVSPDGMQAYEIPKTSSVLISRYGEPTELRIEGF
jgi:intracellular multiplication protein IcmK